MARLSGSRKLRRYHAIVRKVIDLDEFDVDYGTHIAHVKLSDVASTYEKKRYFLKLLDVDLPTIVEVGYNNANKYPFVFVDDEHLDRHIEFLERILIDNEAAEMVQENGKLQGQ